MRWLALCAAVCLPAGAASAAEASQDNLQLTGMMTAGDRFVVFVTLEGQGTRQLYRLGESIGPFALIALDAAQGCADFKRGAEVRRVCLPKGHVRSGENPVGLFAAGGPISLRDSGQPLLRQHVINLVQSSNFHSGSGDQFHFFTAEGVQRDYQDAVTGGEYLVLLLSPARKLRTTGGEVTAAEILVNLHGPGGQNAVFTIDEAGAVVSHAKYAGEIFLELKKTIAAARE
jgi:hypothetical protein